MKVRTPRPRGRVLAPGALHAAGERVAAGHAGGALGREARAADPREAAGHGRGRLGAGDARQLDFGRIEAESTKTLSFTVTNPTDMPVEVTPKLVGADRDEFSVAR